MGQQQSRASKQSRLFMDLWERMEIEEDDEPYWYLLNCVAGLEIDLLNQVKQVAESLPQEDVVKFVVPTVVKTRSHGANRMVRETKVKYQGYVFAKLRLTKETYESIKKIDLCRSWMGTINMKGYKKLPPAPLPLSEEEIDNFDLENPKWEMDEGNDASGTDQGIIVDTEENDMKEMEEEEAIEMEVKTVYKGLKVEDMIKVTAKNKFSGEDGIVKRLKEGMVMIRFFTYGQTFDEWLDPSDVRKLTEEEILKGLGGPDAPITQRDIDGTKEREENRQGRGSRFHDDARNSVGAFGGGPGRERRQDREERRFRRDPISDKKERENWNWYKENETRSQGGGYNDGDGVEFRAGSRSESKRRNDKGNFWAEGDVDSQWGRNNNNRNSRKEKEEEDWSSFVSQASSGGKSKPKNAPSREETDDFFASLMTDLSKDVDGGDGRKGGKRTSSDAPSSSESDDDFFASLMSEIEDTPARTERTPTAKQSNNNNNNNDDDDDFFAALEKEIRSSDNNNSNQSTGRTKAPVSSAVSSEEDDFFASLEMELASDLGESNEDSYETKRAVKPAPAIDDASEDDFFSSLEAELRSDLNEADTTPVATSEQRTNEVVPKVAASTHDAASLNKRTVAELKEMLRDRGLKVSGKKSELIERISSTV
jgi:transcription antitermination factor NusG